MRQVYGFIPRKKIVQMLSTMPTSSPMSIATRTTVRKVAIQTIASTGLSFKNCRNCVTCMSSPFNETTITPARTHRGRGSKNGPTHSKTMARIPQEITEAICVLPPVVNWIIERDREAENGRQEKNDPNTLLVPIASSSWLKSIS